MISNFMTLTVTIFQNYVIMYKSTQHISQKARRGAFNALWTGDKGILSKKTHFVARH